MDRDSVVLLTSRKGSASPRRRISRPSMCISLATNRAPKTLLRKVVATKKQKKEKQPLRKDWVTRALQTHPEIAQLRERVNPVHRAISLGTMYNSYYQQGRTVMGDDEIVKLIVQYLDNEGLEKTKNTLIKESRMKDPPQSKRNALLHLLKIALHDSEEIWNFVIGNKLYDNQMYQLEAHLVAMNMQRKDKMSANEDMHMWDEPLEGNIIYEDDREEIRAASLNKLIEKLTPPANHDLNFSNNFMLTYQSFMTTKKLAAKLKQRYDVPKIVGEPPDDRKKRVMPIQLRVINILRSLASQLQDSINCDDTVLRSLREFIQDTIKDDYPSQAKTLSALLDANQSNNLEDTKMTYGEPPPEPKVPRNIFSPTLTLGDIDEEELSRQLCLSERAIFARLTPLEFLNQNWNKAKNKHLAKNVLALISRFNAISEWVACKIVTPERVKQRAKAFEKFIHVAFYLRKMNNFNSLMALIAAFNNSAVSRLKHTASEIPKNVIEILETLQSEMEPLESFKKYRALLSTCIPPVLPYLGVHLSDLTFMSDANPTMYKGLLNYSRLKLIATTITHLLQYQKVGYNFQPVHQIQQVLGDFNPRVNEKELYNISVKREPKGCHRSQVN